MKPSETTTTTTTPCAAARVVASIDDLLINIFLRLPLDSIIGLKLVCKHWNSIICTSGFLESTPHAGLFHQLTTRLLYAFVPFSAAKIPRPGPPFDTYLDDLIKDTDDNVRILKSCNGILLCCSNGAAFNRKYYVCNPTTNKYITLPSLKGRAVHGLSLAFDLVRSPYYKVVCVVGSNDLYRLEVYSSDDDDGAWRARGDAFAAKDVDFKSGGVYWNGAVHWLSSSEIGESIYFNLGDDQTVIKVMPTPPMLDGHAPVRSRYFGESRGHLHYMDAYKGMVSGFNVYEMRKGYSEWFVKYRVDVSCLVSNLFCVLAVVRGREEEDCFLVLKIGNKKIVLYNLVYKTCETLRELGGVDCNHLGLLANNSGAIDQISFVHVVSLCRV